MQQITIQGHEFTAPTPYVEGHALKPNEAKVMNQVLAENLRNNFAAKVKKALNGSETLSEGQLAELQAAFDEYAASYEFSGESRGPSAPKDPYDAEARKIASALLRTHLAKSNTKVKDLPEGHFDNLVVQLVEKREDIREEAKARVDRAKAFAQVALEGLGA